jgi:hypothetical protein
MTLHGKGWYIWQVSQCEGGSPAAIAERAAAAGATHVLLKVAERAFTFGLDKNGQDLVAPVADALRGRGLQVWGWHYVSGENPVGEANIAVQRAQQLRLDGFVIDAESEFKLPGRSGAARTYMNILRASLPATPLALSSYRYPSLHMQIPWAAFLEKCDYAMPQVYWEQAHNPDQQLARCVTEFNNQSLVGVVRPVIPTGSAYGANNWQATAEDLTKFYSQAVALGLPAANLYSWDYAGTAVKAELWNAAAKFEWPAARQQDILERYFNALNAGDLTQVLRLYHPNAGHVTFKRTVIGLEDLSKWYLDLLKNALAGAKFEMVESSGSEASRHFRWQAVGPRGSVADGEDTLGLREGLIQYHYTSFTYVPR